MVAIHWDKWKKQWRIYKGAVQTFADNVTLKDVYFFVQPEGRMKCIELRDSGQTEHDARFPHAFAFGYLCDYFDSEKWQPINYNPFINELFVFVKTNSPFSYANFATFTPDAKGKVIVDYGNQILMA